MYIDRLIFTWLGVSHLRYSCNAAVFRTTQTVPPSDTMINYK
jgi:hypothetical protein